MKKREWVIAGLVLLFMAAFFVGHHEAEASGNCGPVWKDCTSGGPTAPGGLTMSYVPWTSVEGYGTNSSISTATNVLVVGADSRLSDQRTPADSSVTEAKLSFSDLTSKNVSTTMHGLAPKCPGGGTTYWRDDCTWATPSGGSGSDPFPSLSPAIYWAMDETSLPFANTGSGGTLALSLYSDATVLLRDGVRKGGPVLLTPASGNKGFLYTTTTTVGESNSITMSIWIYVTDYGTAWSPILFKNYSGSDNWESPYANGIQFNGDTNGSLQALVATSGTPRAFQVTAATDRVPLNKWTHLAYTYDASTGAHVLYKNGIAVGTYSNTAANIDWGTHGRWFIGGLYVTGGVDRWLGRVDEIYVDSTVWSAATVQAIAWSSQHYN